MFCFQLLLSFQNNPHLSGREFLVLHLSMGAVSLLFHVMPITEEEAEGTHCMCSLVLPSPEIPFRAVLYGHKTVLS